MFREIDFTKKSKSISVTTPELAELKLTTKKGMSCGGYYVFAQICSSAEQNQICCEEEIVKNGDIGFKGGEIIQSKLQSCTEFIASHIDEDLTIKLEGWNELTVSQFNFFKYNSFIFSLINSIFFFSEKQS